MSDSYKIAVIGDRNSVLGFRALGLETCFADDTAEAVPLLHRLAAENTAVIFITEQLAAGMKAEIDIYRENPRTAVILLPGKGGSLGLGMENLRGAVERAVGANIL